MLGFDISLVQKPRPVGAGLAPPVDDTRIIHVSADATEELVFVFTLPIKNSLAFAQILRS